MKSSKSSQSAVFIGPLRLDPARGVLSANTSPLPVGPRVVALLAALAERPGEVVTKDDLLDRVWPGEDVGESNVAQSVYVARKVLREHGLGEAIVTVPRRGYRLVAEVRPFEVAAGVDTVPTAPPPRPRVHPLRALWVLAGVLLALTIGGATARGTVTSPALSPHGAELYRLGRFYWNRRTLADLAHGAALFTEVTRSDPRSPLGYSGLADSELMLADYTMRPRDRVTHVARAREAVRAALALGPRSAEAHTSYAELLSLGDHDSAAADAEFRRALALDPGYATAHQWYGVSLLFEQQLAAARQELQQAVVLDPTSAARTQWLAEAAYYQRRYGEAIGYVQRTLELDPHRGGALRELGLGYELAGDYKRAIAAFMRLRASDDDPDGAPALLAEAHARAGHRTEARTWLMLALRRRPHDYDTALALLADGQHTRALKMLAGVHEGDKGSYIALDIDPRLDSLRGRYQ
jgi:DNA-binding winged helix-turn-helix (wHTH) protein/tetratricopeptide (TPR) repeat protein